MTRTTNSRVAGFTFLAYTALGLASVALSAQAARGASVAEKLSSFAQHAFTARITIVFGILQTACAIVLAVTLYSLTRDEDPDVALLAMICRVGEGLVGTMSIYAALERLWLATATAPANPSPEAVETLGTYLFYARQGGIDAILFVMGSTLFAWLFLRGRIVPVPLAWLGLVASLLLLVALPLQLVGFFNSPFVAFLWIPLLAYEIPLAFWLIVKGARVPRAFELRNAARA